MPTTAATPLSLDFIDAQLGDMSAAPQILPKLQSLIRDCNTNPDDIFTLIKLDQTLATRVIRTSNSAFFAPRSSIDNIEDAVTYLGYDEVFRIITLVAFAKMMSGPLAAYGLSAGELWEKAVATAVTLEVLSDTHEAASNTGYTIGLLHSIGMVFANKHLQTMQSDTRFDLEAAPERIAADEITTMGLTHADIGAHVLERWKFPENVREPIRFQLRPLECQTYGKSACMLNLAKDIGAGFIRSGYRKIDAPEPDSLVLALFGGTSEVYEKLLEKVASKLAMIDVLLQEL
ncbi:MAG: HDOD domain-containing protein [Opitutaceae bacterium]